LIGPEIERHADRLAKRSECTGAWHHIVYKSVQQSWWRMRHGIAAMDHLLLYCVPNSRTGKPYAVLSSIHPEHKAIGEFVKSVRIARQQVDYET
jgi:hypothetical protein